MLDQTERELIQLNATLVKQHQVLCSDESLDAQQRYNKNEVSARDGIINFGVVSTAHDPNYTCSPGPAGPPGPPGQDGHSFEPVSGVWTPQIITDEDTEISIEIRNANYTVLGKLVICTFDCKIMSVDVNHINSSVPVFLSGLPIESAIDIGYVGNVIFSYYDQLDVNITDLTGTVISASTRAAIWFSKAPGQPLSLLELGDLQSETVMCGTVVYFIK